MNTRALAPKIVGFAGYSGAGKTTLIEQLIPRFVERGLAVSLIKHAHHRFDVDTPGKDSYRHRQAGAREVLLTSDHRWVLMHELKGGEQPTLEEQLARLSPCDLVIVEGFKREPYPKIEVYRPSLGRAPLFQGDTSIIAVATDGSVQTALPTLDLNDPDAIADFVQRCIIRSQP